MVRFALLALAVSLVFIPTASHSQWQPGGAVLSAAASDQISPMITSDGAGGAIVAWSDFRSGGDSDVYTQRVNASGVLQWASDGVALSTAGGAQSDPTLVSDGAGGAIVTWYDTRNGNYDIYAQRVNASGVPQWTPGGVALCTAAGDQINPRIDSDGAGGAIVTWQDLRSGISQDIYAQRVNASGVPQWAGDGVDLCTDWGDQVDPRVASDGAGGAIIAWYDFRNGVDSDIYTQRVSASGVPQWVFNGVALCTATGDQYGPALVSDDAGGAIVTWFDFRSGTADMYAQRVSTSGVPQWAADGVPFCSAVNQQYNPVLVSDGAGGAIVTWYDARSGTSWDVYAQRMSASGVPQWTANGVALCTAAGDQVGPTIASDGAGGAIVAWYDFRNGYSLIYSQRVSASGTPQWDADGVALCLTAGNQFYPRVVSDGAGGGVVIWTDYRGAAADIYSQRVEGAYGYWGHPEPIVASVMDIPNDQGGKVAVNWQASGRDVPVPATIDFYSVWRAVDMAALAPAGDAGVSLTSIDRITADASPGLRTMLSGSPYYWELVATQTAYRWPYYSFSASTRADSLAGDSGDEYFMVAAHAVTDEHIAFMSNAMSGHSVDNLAPVAPLFLTAQRSGANVLLKWNGVHVPDLGDYAVYRGSSSGVTPVPGNFLASDDDTLLLDTSAPPTTLYYIVTAYDVHKNQSAPSNEASVSGSTGVGDTPAITQLTVLQNHPNPFAGATEFEIGLPAASEVAIEVYDVAGRRVRGQVLPRQDAGWQHMAFDGRNDAGQPLASGVYFCRVSANGTMVTRKMVIAR